MRRLSFQKLLIISMMGLASGLPYSLVTTCLQAWMTKTGVDIKMIGVFASVTLPYTLKFLWSPLLDRFSLSALGRRRSWMILSQIALFVFVLLLSGVDPIHNLTGIFFLALGVSFASATQDIAIDAWRRESLADEELGLGSSLHVTTYLIAVRLISGALALFLADQVGWPQTYRFMALLGALGLVASFLAKEPSLDTPAPRSLREAVVEPFLDYFQKSGALWILFFIFLYKAGDNMAQQMTITYYLKSGFTQTEVGAVSKIVGWISLALGGLVGGGLLLRWRIKSALFGFGVLQALSTLAFVLIEPYPLREVLAGVIAFENFTAGMGTSAFVAFMASLTNKKFTATQYALLTSAMGVPRSFLSMPTGWMVEQLGFQGFFVTCTLAAVPGLFLIRFLLFDQDKAS